MYNNPQILYTYIRASVEYVIGKSYCYWLETNRMCRIEASAPLVNTCRKDFSCPLAFAICTAMSLLFSLIFFFHFFHSLFFIFCLLLYSTFSFFLLYVFSFIYVYTHTCICIFCCCFSSSSCALLLHFLPTGVSRP